MAKRILAAAALALLVSFSPNFAMASGDDADTDTRFVKARVVEVGERRIAVITRSEIEHVIAVDGEATKIKVGDRLVSVKDLREGDVVTVELDELNPMKFARNITVGVRLAEQTARTP
ncbi:MAG TPA: hypothetical protein VK421_14590 [Pyrinomonadaceae bacterium]|nr:hypothetical protein [Pyrinomonadaceae bacterium]